jgi:membrane protein DedA with SNARE-associated domain
MNEIVALLTRHGAAVVFAVAFLEQIGAPVPAIPVIIVAAAVAANTGGSLSVLVILAVAGALIADTIWFFLGKRHGYRVLGFLCRISLSPDSCVRKTETFFDRWGMLSLIFSKFVPGFSLIAPPMAGALPQMTWRRFAAYDTAGALIWAGASVAAGVLFRRAIDRLLDSLAELGNWALIVLGSALAIYLLYKWWERHRFYKQLRLSRIAVDELRERISSGGPVVILDVRSPAAQKRDPQRIPGARMTQAEDLDATLAGVDQHQEIVLYCT